MMWHVASTASKPLVRRPQYGLRHASLVQIPSVVHNSWHLSAAGLDNSQLCHAEVL
jgi:hypothetical protein